MIYGSLADVLGRKPISILCVVGAFASALFTGLFYLVGENFLNCFILGMQKSAVLSVKERVYSFVSVIKVIIIATNMNKLVKKSKNSFKLINFLTHTSVAQLIFAYL
jgi:hypothetical protein